MAASQTANSTLESILNATAALRQFDEHFNAAQEILAETSQIANQGWNGINMVSEKLKADHIVSLRDTRFFDYLSSLF